MTEKLLSRILYFCMAIGAIGWVAIEFAQDGRSGFLLLSFLSCLALIFLWIRRLYKDSE